MYQVVLLRHGESTWNKKGLFTGWTDVNLSRRGREEAKAAGRTLKKNGLSFDVAFTSLLRRASDTLRLALKEMKAPKIPTKADVALNERHYGKLQGMNKQATIAKYGERQVFIWRRSYATRPPQGESLRDVEKRVVPFWRTEIVPQIKKGKRVIIAASGNSLRALARHLDKLSAQEVAELNIPTGIPLVYELDDKMRPCGHHYLASPKELQAAVDRVKKQGKGKA